LPYKKIWVSPTYTPAGSCNIAGVTKAQIIASMGQPDDTRASGNQEFLIYRNTEIYIRLTDGRVDSYGMLKDGDFEKVLPIQPDQLPQEIRFQQDQAS